MSEITQYAFYGPSSANHGGDTTYLGQKSDGLDRKYFGPDLAAAKKLVKAARDSEHTYRLDEIKYDRVGPGLTTSKTRTLYVSPKKASPTQ